MGMPKMMLTQTEEDNVSPRHWIVVADADQGAANRLAGHLLHQRLRAYPTGRGGDALCFAEAHPMSLAVIDVELADMTGCLLVAHLRAIDPALPVIMTTADFGAAIEIEARRLGIVRYVQKPFDFEALDLVARRVFAMRARPAAGIQEA